MVTGDRVLRRQIWGWRKKRHRTARRRDRSQTGVIALVKSKTTHIM
ncbi:hypothetical protein [Nostoc sp. FACHB-133]|nr:hypothetical protein [Nostoc sp. FACHB-133]MBD2527091.1 hypothetical protein [Nostoc sp. FACHB-133]